MKCPHCSVAFSHQPEGIHLGSDDQADWTVLKERCPECRRWVIHMLRQVYINGDPVQERTLIFPRASSRKACPPEVPQEFGEDYREACLVFSDSPKASAALSRRCLQHLLREHCKVKTGNLADEIQEVINRGILPSQLTEAIDAVRNTGNFGAHPIKSKNSGEVLPVEPGEAEWNLDVLEALFDFYFVQPAVLKAKRDALNKKLAEAGKPAMK